MKNNVLLRPIDEKELRQRVLLDLATSPVTLVPFLGGATLFLAQWALGLESGLGIFASLACMLGSVGVFLTRLIMSTDSTTKKVLEQMRRETDQARELVLDELGRKLCADGDPRTEQYLDDLRALIRSFREGSWWSDELTAGSAVEISTGVEDLFQGCVRSLEKSLELWHTADRMSVESAKAPLLKQRERIIRDVEAGIRQLGQILAEMTRFGSGEGTGVDLDRIKKELAQSLDIARRVDEQVRGLAREVKPEIEGR